MLQGLTITVRARPSGPPAVSAARNGPLRRTGGVQGDPVVSLVIAGCDNAVAAVPVLEKNPGRLYTGRPNSRQQQSYPSSGAPSKPILQSDLQQSCDPNLAPSMDIAETPSGANPANELPMRMGFRVPGVSTLPASPTSPSDPEAFINNYSQRLYPLELNQSMDLLELSVESVTEQVLYASAVSAVPAVPPPPAAAVLATSEAPTGSAPYADKEGYVGTIAAQLSDAMRLDMERSERQRLKALKREQDVATLQPGSHGVMLLPRCKDNKAAAGSKPEEGIASAVSGPGAITLPGFGNIAAVDGAARVVSRLERLRGKKDVEDFEDSGDEMLQSPTSEIEVHTPSIAIHTNAPIIAAQPSPLRPQADAPLLDSTAGPIPTVTFESTQRSLRSPQRAERPTSSPTIPPKDPNLPPPVLALLGSQLSSAPIASTRVLSPPASPLQAELRPDTPLEPSICPPSPALIKYINADIGVIKHEDDLSLHLTERSLLTVPEETNPTTRGRKSPYLSVKNIAIADTDTNAGGTITVKLQSPRTAYPVAPMPLMLFSDEDAGARLLDCTVACADKQPAVNNAWGGGDAAVLLRRQQHNPQSEGPNDAMAQMSRQDSICDRMDSNVALALVGMLHVNDTGGREAMRGALWGPRGDPDADFDTDPDTDHPTTYAIIAGAGFKVQANTYMPLFIPLYMT